MRYLPPLPNNRAKNPRFFCFTGITGWVMRGFAGGCGLGGAGARLGGMRVS